MLCCWISTFSILKLELQSKKRGRQYYPNINSWKIHNLRMTHKMNMSFILLLLRFLVFVLYCFYLWCVYTWLFDVQFNETSLITNALRFYLIQPSPNWTSFGLRDLMCYTLSQTNQKNHTQKNVNQTAQSTNPYLFYFSFCKHKAIRL